MITHNEDMGARIKAERLKRSLSQEQLGLLADSVSRAAVGQWESGKTTPSGPHLLNIARGLGVTPEFLAFGVGKPDNVTVSGLPLIKVPLISWVEAGVLATTIDIYEPGDAEAFIDVSSNRTSLIALRVSGNSMNLEAKDGSVIIVDYDDKTLVSGKLYVIKTADGDVTFKRYRSDPDRFEPCSSEPYNTIFPSEGWSVVGRVIKVERDL